MATVYLAEDLKHNRQVAIKLFRPALSEAVGAERFLREIEVTARLNHPQILPLHDSGKAGDLLYYVMPLVGGESLRDRIEREKQLPIDEGLQIASNVAAALAYAHRQGVIHRDIKPANILLHEGQAMVADFGIALAVQTADEQRMTATGLSIGSPHYMSPEQAAGDRELDARSDVYSLGCVLFEMLAGEPPHTGPNVNAIVARVLTEDPRPLRVVRNTVPASVEAAVSKALAKTPADRFASAAEFAEALSDRSFSTSEAVVAHASGPTTSKKRRLVPVMLGLAAVAATLLAVLSQRAPNLGPPVQHEPLTFSGRAVAPVVSPDGNQVAYLRGQEDEYGYFKGSLMLLDLTTGAAVEVVRDTHLLDAPVWSPDGRDLLFLASTLGGVDAHGIYIMPWRGGPHRIIAATGAYPAYDLSPDGHRLAIAEGRTLRFIDVEGGGVVTDSFEIFDQEQTVYRLAWSRNPERLAYSANRGNVPDIVGIVSTDGEILDTLGLEGGWPRWTPRGDALYNGNYSETGQGLMRVRVDRRSGRFEESPRLVMGVLSMGEFDVAPDGKDLLYERGEGSARLWVYDVGESGDLSGKQLTTGTANNLRPKFSPDGSTVAFIRNAAGRSGVYVMPVDGGPQRQVTFGVEIERDVTWSPDGRTLVFGAREEGGVVAMVVSVAGGEPRRIGSNPAADGAWARQFAWSPDGGRLLYGLEGHTNFGLVDLATGEEDWLLADAVPDGPLVSPVFSPDGDRVVVGRYRERSDSTEILIVRLSDRVSHIVDVWAGYVRPWIWTDDDVVYYRGAYEAEHSIFTAAADGGPIQPFVRLPDDCADGSLTRDLSRVACWNDDWQTDIWIARNFDPSVR